MPALPEGDESEEKVVSAKVAGVVRTGAPQVADRVDREWYLQAVCRLERWLSPASTRQ
jgi:hypothetical protein